MKIITPNKNAFDTHGKCEDVNLSVEAAEELLGVGFHVMLMLWDEYLLVTKDWKNYNRYSINKTATALVGEPVYGPIIQLDLHQFNLADFKIKGGTMVKKRS